MREIKFRVRDGKDMREIDREYIRLGSGWSVWGYANERDKLIANHETGALMQYTGLKDKNGLEIYEGDIVKGGVYYDFDDGIGVVKFGEFESDSSGYEYTTQTCYGWYIDCSDYLKDQERDSYYANTFVPKKLEVIGNLHQNPELVKVD